MKDIDQIKDEIKLESEEIYKYYKDIMGDDLFIINIKKLSNINTKNYGPIINNAVIKKNNDISAIIKIWNKEACSDILKTLYDRYEDYTIEDRGLEITIRMPEIGDNIIKSKLKELDQTHEQSKSKIRQSRQKFKKMIQELKEEIGEDTMYDNIKQLDDNMMKCQTMIDSIYEQIKKDILKHS